MYRIFIGENLENFRLNFTKICKRIRKNIW